MQQLEGELAIEAMKARVYELNRMSAAIHDERSALERRLAEQLATWKPGQRVLYRDRGEYEITEIKPGYGVGSVKYFGRKVLKSGALHANTTEIRTYNEGRDFKAVAEQ
jgi:hypothetical protein